MSARFSAPAYPGEALAIELWQEGATLAFRVRAADRGGIVLDGGHAALRAARA